MKKFIILLIILIIVVGSVFFFKTVRKPKEITEKEASEKVLKYLNEKFLLEPIASLTKVSQESGLYRVDVDVKGNKMNTYITKDGKIFFPEGIETEKEEVSISQWCLGD